MAAKTHPAPGEGAPDHDAAREAERLIQETARAEAKEVGKYRAWIYSLLGVGGVGLAVYYAPDIIADPVRQLVGMQPAGKDEFKGPTAKERIAKARPDAKALVDRIIAEQPRVELNTVTDEKVRERITGILADKTVSPEELWVTLSAWQQRELVAIARRYKALDAPDAASPDALRKRLPVAGRAGGQLREAKGRGDVLSLRWQDWTAVLNSNEDTPDHKEKVKAACMQLRAELVNEARVPFSSDVVVLIGNGGGYPINAKGAQRLVNFERELLGQFVVERHALIDQAETYNRTMQGVRRLEGLQTQFRDTMKGNGMKTETIDARVHANGVRLKRIDAATADLARTVTVIELRNAAIADPAWKADADKAVEAYFGAGKVPAATDLPNALRNDRIRKTDALRAKLNNDLPEGEEAEEIIRGVAYTLPLPPPKDGGRVPEQAFRGDPAEADRRLTDFLKRTETSADPRVQKLRGIMVGLSEKRPMTLKDAQDAYAEMKKDQEMPFATGLTETLSEWAGQHEAAFFDPKEPFRHKNERERFSKSRQDLLEGIVKTLAELENLRSLRVRAQGGFSATQNGVDTGAQPDTQWVLDPQVGGDLPADLRQQAVQGSKDVRLFLDELKGEHALRGDDLKRDAAAAGAKIARKVIDVLSRVRGMRGQNAPDTARMVEVVQAFDTAPIVRLAESYEALEAFLADPANTPERAVADRRAAKVEDIKTQRAEYNKKPLNAKEVQDILRQNLTPAQRAALRLALEDQRQDAVRPMLNEEAANLLALAALSDEGAGKVGDMQNARNRELEFILFVLGVIAAYQGAKGRVGIIGERWGARRRNVRVLRAYEAKRKTSGAPPPVDEKAGRAERRAVVDKVNLSKASNVKRRLTALQKEAVGISFDNVGAANQPVLAGFARTVQALTADLRAARETYDDLEIQPEIGDRVRLRIATEALVEDILARVRTACDRDPKGPARRTLGEVYEALEALGGALHALQPELPALTPKLETADIDAADTGDVLLLACQAGLDIDGTGPEDLRLQLKIAKAKLTPPAAE